MKIIKTKLVILFLCLSGIIVNGQSRRVADKYFEEFAYFKAAKIYEAVYQKGDTTTYLLKRLGDAYYNNSQTENAEFWYKKLIEDKKEKDPSYLFKYSQVLRSNGSVQKADSIYNLLKITIDSQSGEKYVNKENNLQDFLNNGDKKISLRNLAINTPYSDFGGVIFEDKVYFASASPKGEKREKLYRWNNQPFLNLYKSDSYFERVDEAKTDSIFELENKTILSPGINTQFHESSPVFTKDGKTMYFSRVNFNGKKLGKDKKLTVNLKLFKAERVGDDWGNVEELPFNSDDYSVAHPALSPDGKSLYFASDMPGTLGETDIFKVEIKEDGFGEPVNLGKNVNTTAKEMFPFISDDNVLFFSSNGHKGLGLLDIFQTKIYNDSTYSQITNLDHPFNSKKDDFSFFIAKDGKKGFFSSNRAKGKGDDDIYSFYITEIPESERCYQYVTGVVTDKVTKERIPNAIVKLVDDLGTVLEEKLTDSRGSYNFKLECKQENYVVIADKRDYRNPDKKNISVLGKNKDERYTADLVLDPLIIGDQIVIKPIYFDYDKDFIREDAQYELENIVTVMTNHPKMVIKIESHTDSRGAKSYNRNLSDRRAKSTRDFIISRGIEPERIESAIGYGEDKLLNHCDDKNSKKCTEEEHQLNRRSYFYIVRGKEVSIDNVKPTVIDKKGYNNQKDMLEKLNKFKANKTKKLRSKSENDKCFKEDNDCGK
ncbi:outer membrane protein OmpA-like peptidoglycan-associated protein [Tenacibaculum skagerrakense]|uniref:Outer membrane protein OmpA-like peptidoglycan-associated protein n=1 Tax=Tenacibaculum skagerrakense TaxID=186571 RepID=A0A4R2NMP3_9FLAO|nr:OmpA family protein [Tenacibaculum skagerrakense]TCP22575.1 outer membrane protein OmpA-like peptidoglycan-associated protein [Tenacibaculum skagerrakense]